MHSGNVNDNSEYNVQSSLPMMSEHDAKALALLGKEFEIDFVALTYAISGSDVAEMRDFLDSIGLEHTKILAKVRVPQHDARVACWAFLQCGPCSTTSFPHWRNSPEIPSI